MLHKKFQPLPAQEMPELFVEHQVQQILNRYQEEQGAEVSVCSNVILSEAASVGSTHELDVVFSINGKFFWRCV